MWKVIFLIVSSSMCAFTCFITNFININLALGEAKGEAHRRALFALFYSISLLLLCVPHYIRLILLWLTCGDCLLEAANYIIFRHFSFSFSPTLWLFLMAIVWRQWWLLFLINKKKTFKGSRRVTLVLYGDFTVNF